MKDYHKPDYWKDWYWNKGGRDKVQYSRKVKQPISYDSKRNYKSSSGFRGRKS